MTQGLAGSFMEKAMSAVGHPLFDVKVTVFTRSRHSVCWALWRYFDCKLSAKLLGSASNAESRVTSIC